SIMGVECEPQCTGTAMSSGWEQCYSQCPPTTVTIQPPPFVLNIPGPALHCPDQPLCIEQCNPCVPNMIPYHQGISRGGYSSISQGMSTGFSGTSTYSQKSRSRFQGQCGSCQ
uniref:Keratin n=1 Tax=Salvator merianae TaxID=96440 RepID=A0A8D0AZB2_SALMN